MKVESGNNCVCVVHWSAKTETTQDLENILLPSQTVTGLIETGLFLLVFWKKISLSCYRNADVPLLKKCCYICFFQENENSFTMWSHWCTVLNFLIQSNHIKTVSKTTLSLIHFDRIRESQKSTSEKLEDIYDSDSWSCANQMSSLLPNILTLQVANKLVMCDIKRQKTIMLSTSAVNKRTHCLLS